MRAYLHRLATDQNNGPGARFIKVFLYIFSLLYGLVVFMLIGINRSLQRPLPCKVISVGNITLGGTGKTPLVELIASYLSRQGHTVAIITRGYRRGRGSGDRCAGMGDEPYMLQQRLKNVPVIVDADRMRAARRAQEQYGADTVILDDGFQQWALKKDLEIVTIDATNPFGNRHMLPRGVLRQPMRTLRDADMFVFTKTNVRSSLPTQLTFLSQLNPTAMIFETAHLPVGLYRMDAPDEMLGTHCIAKHRVLLVSGIADPGSFTQVIKDLSASVAAHLIFEDHHCYTSADWVYIRAQCRAQSADTVVTTEKDSVRLKEIMQETGGIQVLVLRIALAFMDDENGFYQRLLRVYNV